MKPIITTIAIVSVLSLSSNDAWSADSPKFSLPLNCAGDTECFLQNLMDMDFTTSVRDPFCSRATYNGHKGTDIRVRDIPAMRKGVPVLAMADGIVLRARNGVAEKLIETKADRDRVKDIECGNGLVIDHGIFGGKKWTTQLCHMAKNSLRVKQGDSVKRGQTIGMVGLSGMTQFPHVHVSLRVNNKLRDLLTNTKPKTAQTKACTSKFSKKLLTTKAFLEFQKMNSPLLAAGFTDSPVNGKTILKGRVSKLTRKGPLIFYAKFLNLKKGDIIRLTVRNSSGVYVKQKTKPLTKRQATYTAFVGKRRALKKESSFSGQAELWRDGKVIFTSKPVAIEF